MKSSINIIIAFCFLQTLSFAQNGTVDSDFGVEGELHLDIDALDELEGLLTDPDGNTYFYGHSSEDLDGIYPFDIIIGKIDPNGQLDLTFGEDGLFRDDFPGYSISSLTHAVWDTSGIYFLGHGRNNGELNENGFFIGKINLDGDLDLSFGEDGFYTSDFMGTYNTAGSLIMDSNAKVVFCGATTNDVATGLEYPMVGRLNQNGVPDSTFGTTGVVVWDYFEEVVVDLMDLPLYFDRHGEGGYFTEIIEVNDSYFCSGYFQNSAHTQMYIAKLSNSGSFSSDFVAPMPYPYQVETGVNHFTEDLDFFEDHIYLSFRVYGFEYGTSFTIQKLDTTGEVLNTYAIEYEGNYSYIKGLEFYEGNPYVTGYTVDIDNVAPGHASDDFMLYSLNQNFNPHKPFGTNGFVKYHFPFDDEQGAEDLIYSNNRFVVGGYVNNVHSGNYTDLAFLGVKVDPTNGIEKEEKESLILYPNPTQNTFQVKGNGQINFDYEIYNLSGKKLAEGSCTSIHQTINVSSLKQGYYTLRVTSSENSFELSFIKE